MSGARGSQSVNDRARAIVVDFLANTMQMTEAEAVAHGLPDPAKSSRPIADVLAWVPTYMQRLHERVAASAARAIINRASERAKASHAAD